MSSNTWVGTLLQINPDYLEILKKWEHGPKISTKISPINSVWYLKVYQDCDFENFDPLWFQEELYERLSWCEQQLAKWHDVRRQLYDTWIFDNKEDAEKFQTLYRLKWMS